MVELLLSIEIFYVIHSCGHIYQHGIEECEGGHAFHDDHSPGNDDGVVAPLDIDADFFPGFIDGLLGLEDGGRRLYMCADQNAAAVADAAEDTARVVRPFGDFAVSDTEEIIVLAACPAGDLTAVSDFHRLDRPDGHNGFCEVRIQLLKHRIADSGGETVHDTFHTARSEERR